MAISWARKLAQKGGWSDIGVRSIKPIASEHDEGVGEDDPKAFEVEAHDK
jgi:hypothetical protein